MIALRRLARSSLCKFRGIATYLSPKLCKAQVTNSTPTGNASSLGESLLEIMLRQKIGNLGQPTSASHPHLIRSNELVPGVEMIEFQSRRNTLMKTLQSYARTMGNEFNGRSCQSHMVILSSATKKYMSGKIPYVFRQNSDFYYLTGCLEPDSALIMTIDESSNVQSILFMRPKDAHAELWDGPRTGPELAVGLFGVNEAYPIEQFNNWLAKRFTAGKPHLWFDAKLSEVQAVNESVLKLTSSEQSPLLPVYTFVESMRLLKSPAEMELMRRTCEIASQSFNEVIAETRPGQSEHHLFASIDYKCRMRDASFLAYPPVVAAGKNATIIHYVNNTQLLKPRDLVLMDAGCEYGGYTSDITRTWPAGGTFTDPQRTLYDMLAQLQKEVIETIMKPGGETLDQLFEVTCCKLGKYLQEIGLISKHLSDYKELASQGYRFCPHHVSHYLGMDVHDTPHVPRNTAILPGMVFTVEPGIYISPDRTDVPVEFRGIGIRIEDDILINQNNEVEVLTGSCIKDCRELENLFKQKD
ncbi:xaa-Pro aminopeptidase 3 [Drosophila tropicalis]|uniref:xaa-Pro aminopeptidase 3 n=1 Tax=Drosophila tropicalis TaxID=46794 RepID=UPI0035ABF211